MDSETSEVVDLVHSLVLQTRVPVAPAVDEQFSKPSKVFSSVASSPSRENNISRSQTFPVRKKVQITSAPLKPPDIGNSSLFPSVEESIVTHSPTPKRIPLKAAGVGNSGNLSSRVGAPDAFSLAGDKKLRTLEAKLTEPLAQRKQESFPHPAFSSPSSRRTSLNELPSTPSRRTPRSAKLYSELSAERRQQLDELAEKYSKSLDTNQCRSVLDEIEFLLQLFNTTSNNVIKMTPGSEKQLPLLQSAPEQAYFVVKIVICQLDRLFISIPTCVPQLIIDNYPHKIPKPVRKHIDDWIAAANKAKNSSIPEDDTIPIDFQAKTVTFQSEKDGRSNFPHQTDFHAFCKQRDLFYSIRENWTSSTNSGGMSNNGQILDRSKARMSFPPVNSNNGPSSRFVDSLPFKIQSLFQMNQSPTNLFHMASLFVSHYLLEARAQELGGVPKDDNMKEFFQSHPAKLLQLNSRFSTSANETLETEQTLSLAFQKQFLMASSPKFLQHVVDRLVNDISQAESNMESVNLASSSQICRSVKDTVHLARLLGFAVFLPYLPEETKHNLAINTIERESILQVHVRFRTYHSPPLDLKHYIEKALRCGRLTATCPWVLEYLLQCDPVTLLLPSYQPILATILSLYRNILVGKSSPPCHSMSNLNRNFLRFYFGVLFSSKNFPDSAFLLATQDMLCEPEQGNMLATIDTVEAAARSLTEFFFDDKFNRLKRILSWGKLEVSHPSVAGEFRHIRPIPASEKLSSAKPATSVSKEKQLQSQLEATFFELYPPTVKRSVDFIAERMASNFVQIAKTQLFTNIRTSLANQGVFGVRAAEKCKMRIGEEMGRYFGERCILTVKLFLEQNVTLGVLGICQRITIRKAKESVAEWIKNYINPGMFPDTGLEVENTPQKPNSSTAAQGATQSMSNISEDPPFEILILIHRTLRKLHSGQKIDPQLVDKVLSCQNFSKAQWAFVPLVDWGLGLVAFQPQVLNSVRIKQLVSLWKSLWTPTAKIINPRNLMLLSKSENSRDSWIKLGSVTQQLISEGVVKADDLEQQCFQLLREDWHDDMHKRISEFLTIVLETFQDRAEGYGESAQVLDWVAWLCSGQPDQD